MDNDTIISRLVNYHCQIQPITYDSAAVVIFIIKNKNTNLTLLLTKRSDNGIYAGDICFPGGKSEESDLKTTAIREVAEELGLVSDDYEFIGQLDDFEDRFGNTVRPYVATLKLDKLNKLVPNSGEIKEVYYFPIDEINNIKLDPLLSLKSLRQPSYSYIKDDLYIWGLTASILVHIGNIAFELNRKVGRFIRKSTD